MTKYRLAAVLLLVAAAAPNLASAERLNLAGSYGAAEGCEFGDREEFDRGMSLLTNTRFRAGDVDCEVLDALPAKDGAYALTMMCNRASEKRTTIDFFRLSRSTEADSYDLADQAGKVLGTLKRCDE